MRGGDAMRPTTYYPPLHPDTLADMKVALQGGILLIHHEGQCLAYDLDEPDDYGHDAERIASVIPGTIRNGNTIALAARSVIGNDYRGARWLMRRLDCQVGITAA
jgi:hypothetical protein